MSTALKCPNPSCPYLFDPSTVPPGVVLACPRCGMRFTLGTGGNHPTHSGPTGASPAFPGAAPTATAPGRPQAPVNAAFGGMTPATASAHEPQGPRLPVRESPLQTALLVIVGVVALTAAGIAVWYQLSHKEGERPESAAYRYSDLNLGFDPPPAPWAPDGEMRALLDAPFFEVYRRENPEAYMAFGARDFLDHEPRPSELTAVLTAALKKIVSSPKHYPEEIPTTWMGRPVIGYKFTGLTKEAGSVEGEAIAVSYQGIGYWFISWTGANEIYLEQKPAFAVGRSGLQLLKLREGWRPTVPPVIEFKNNVIGYTILDSEHVWHLVEDEELARGQDPKADKYLVIQAKRDRDKVIEAQLVVAILDVGSDNPLQDARAHLESRRNELAETQGKYTFKEHTDPPEGDPTHPAEGNAPVLMLRATNEKNEMYSWLYAVSAVRVGEKTVALYAWCPWGDRRKYDTRFIQIAKSLRADAADE